MTIGRVGIVQHTALVALVFLAASAVVWSQETAASVLTLEGVVDLAVQADSGVRDLRKGLSELLDEQGLAQYRDKVSLTLTGGLGDVIESGMGWPSVNGKAELYGEIELVPQLTLGGTLGATGAHSDAGGSGAAGSASYAGSVGLTFRPFADTTGDRRDDLEIRSTETQTASAIRKTSYAAIGDLLDAVDAVASQELARRRAAVAEANLESTTALHERDRATDQQLQSARDSLRSANQQVVRASVVTRQALESLSQTIGIPVEADQLPRWDGLAMESIIDAGRSAADGLDRNDAAAMTAAVMSAGLEVESASIVLEATRNFNPDTFSVSASLGIAGGTDAPSVTSDYRVEAKVVLKPSNWDGSARDEAAQTVSDREQDYEYATRMALLNLESALLEFAIAVENVDAAQEDLEIAQQDLVEAEFRSSRGDITRLAVTQAELAVQEAEHSLRSAQATAVRRWYALEYLQL